MDKPIALAHRGEFWAMQWTGDNLAAFKAWLEPLGAKVRDAHVLRYSPRIEDIDEAVLWLEWREAPTSPKREVRTVSPGEWALVTHHNGAISTIEAWSDCPTDSNYRRLGEPRVIEREVTIEYQDNSAPFVYVDGIEVSQEVLDMAINEDPLAPNHGVRVTIERIEDE